MAVESLLGLAGAEGAHRERRVYGVVLAQVIGNEDTTGQGRVQLRLPWLPGIDPWARVAVLAAGPTVGTYFMPQQGDEVLVAFNHGDVREPFVIGCLWNGLDRSPARAGTDARTRRLIRTPSGHEIALDETAGSIVITSASKHRVSLTPSSVSVATANDTATVTLEASGAVTVEAAQSLVLRAPSILLDGENVDISGSASARIDGGQACVIQASQVLIN